jgi:hypothetical protein
MELSGGLREVVAFDELCLSIDNWLFCDLFWQNKWKGYKKDFEG